MGYKNNRCYYSKLNKKNYNSKIDVKIANGNRFILKNCKIILLPMYYKL